MINRKTVGLTTFLKGSSNPADRMPGCANYDHHYGGCLFRDTCLVQDGKRCSYFETTVLPTAKDIGLQSVYSQYEKSIGIEGALKISIGSARLCPECGAGLKLRQRFCDSCSESRRRDSYRKSRENRRSKRNS